jgi:hypothetical protein
MKRRRYSDSHEHSDSFRATAMSGSTLSVAASAATQEAEARRERIRRSMCHIELYEKAREADRGSEDDDASSSSSEEEDDGDDDEDDEGWGESPENSCNSTAA